MGISFAASLFKFLLALQLVNSLFIEMIE
jgi:hypothetical protein